jgi:hypothetical protein
VQSLHFLHAPEHLYRVTQAYFGEASTLVVPLAAATTLNRGMRAPTLLAEVFPTLERPADAVELAKLALARNPSCRRAQALQARLDQVADDPEAQ